MKAAAQAGGFVGANADPTAAVENPAAWSFTYCKNAATVIGVTAGGLIGSARRDVNVSVSYCMNTGTINGLYAAGGLINADLGNATKVLNGRIENSFNMGELTADTFLGGIVGDYVTNAANAGNALTLYNCFDISKRGENGTNGALVGKAVGTAISFENSYGAVAAESAGTYTELVGSYDGEATISNAGVASATNERVMLSTGSIKIGAMIERLETAIAALGEVEMPYGGISDGKPRDYTWYYANGALVNKGTKEAPYEIANAAQFATIGALSNGFQDAAQVGDMEDPVNFNGKYFKLTGDIDLTGYKADPINAEGATIVFDGNGKKISNWTIANTEYGGMFSAIGKNSVVKDLTLDNVDVAGNSISAGLIARGATGVTVYNVVLTDSCSVAPLSGNIAAGIIGTIVDEAATPDNTNPVKITFCVNKATISSLSVVGGIVGKLKGNFDYQISHCANKGALNITSTLNANFYVGGIIASTEGPADISEDTPTYMNSFIKDCYNVGAFTTTDTISYCYVGGIAGYLHAPQGAELTISNCFNVNARRVSTKCGENKLNNGGIGATSSTNLTKFVDTCYAVNAENSEHPFTALLTWGRNTSSQVDDYSKLVQNVTEPILDGNGASSTVKAGMEKIDAAIASKTELVWDFVAPDNGEDTTPDNGGDATDNADMTTQAPADTTETEKPKKKGCKSTLDSTYAVIALVAVLGFAFVAKKKENE